MTRRFTTAEVIAAQNVIEDLLMAAIAANFAEVEHDAKAAQLYRARDVFNGLLALYEAQDKIATA